MPAPFPPTPVYTNTGPQYPALVPYPPVAPVVNGTAITVDMFLRDPLRVQRVMMDMTRERFLADRMFRQGGAATGGAVIFDQVLNNDLYLNRDVAAIKPGSEFPILTDQTPAPLVARTTKWGGAVLITYEERDRDARDILNRELTKLRNTIVRKVDAVAVATFRAAPTLNVVASGSWASSTSHIVRDLATAETLVDTQDMGYVLDTVLINPKTELNMVTNDELLKLIYQTRGGLGSPVTMNANQSQLSGLVGLPTWYKSNRVDEDEVILLSSGQSGSISDERPLYTRVVDQPEAERILVMGARLTVPYVTDPKSVVRITGVK